MNNFNFEAMMEHGFLIIPKALLQQQIEDPNIEDRKSTRLNSSHP